MTVIMLSPTSTASFPSEDGRNRKLARYENVIENFKSDAFRSMLISKDRVMLE